MDIQIRPSRRKSLSIEITPRGEILVRCPMRMPRKDILRFLEEKRPWIEGHLQKMAAAPALPSLTEEEHRTLIRRAKEILPQKVAHYAALMDVSFGRITIRSQRTRWGSCSAAGNLSFNCLLMLAPEEVQDYVVVHELCHRKEMNHSSRFWTEVEQILPDFRQQKRWLKDNGASLLARLPDAQK